MRKFIFLQKKAKQSLLCKTTDWTVCQPEDNPADPESGLVSELESFWFSL